MFFRVHSSGRRERCEPWGPGQGRGQQHRVPRKWSLRLSYFVERTLYEPELFLLGIVQCLNTWVTGILSAKCASFLAGHLAILIQLPPNSQTVPSDPVGDQPIVCVCACPNLPHGRSCQGLARCALLDKSCRSQAVLAQ